MLLPYIEQTPLYNACNFSFTAEFDGGINSTVALTVVAGYLCPSDPNAARKMNTNSYAACMGTTTDGMFNPPTARGTSWPPGRTPRRLLLHRGHGPVRAGRLLRDRQLHRRHLEHGGLRRGPGRRQQGLERLRAAQQPAQPIPGQHGLWRQPRRGRQPPPRRLLEPGPRPRPCSTKCKATFQTSATLIGDHRGYRWTHGITGYSMFNTIQVPNDSQYPFGVCILTGGPNNYPDSGFSFGASSAHPGGCNVMMGDGSVKFVKSTINRQTWWSLGTKAGGEVLAPTAIEGPERGV